MFTVVTWKLKRWHVKALVRALKAQVAQIPQLRGMIEVETNSNTPQAEVVRIGAEHLQISQHVDMSKEEVAQMQARCNEF